MSRRFPRGTLGMVLLAVAGALIWMATRDRGVLPATYVFAELAAALILLGFAGWLLTRFKKRLKRHIKRW